MRVIERPFSEFLRQPNDVVAELVDHDVVLRRRCCADPDPYAHAHANSYAYADSDPHPDPDTDTKRLCYGGISAVQLGHVVECDHRLSGGRDWPRDQGRDRRYRP